MGKHNLKLIELGIGKEEAEFCEWIRWRSGTNILNRSNPEGFWI